jgi:hypothetical protein
VFDDVKNWYDKPENKEYAEEFFKKEDEEKARKELDDEGIPEQRVIPLVERTEDTRTAEEIEKAREEQEKEYRELGGDY